MFKYKLSWRKELFLNLHRTSETSLVAQTVKASAYSVGDLGLIPGLGRSPGEGNGNPLQYSCLENPMDRGAWQATVHGVAKSQTWLSNFISFHFWAYKVHLRITTYNLIDTEEGLKVWDTEMMQQRPMEKEPKWEPDLMYIAQCFSVNHVSNVLINILQVICTRSLKR